MKTQNKVLILFFITIGILTIVFRYPFDSYEVGWDSYVYHNLSDVTASVGRLPFYENPLSYFGMTPESIPSSLIILITEFFLISNIELGWTIWICPMVFSFIGSILMFMISKKIFKNVNIAFFSTLLYSCSITVINLTYWTATTRGLFLFLLPLIFFILISLTESFNKNKIFILIIVSLILISTHSLGYYLVFIFIPIFICIIYYQNRMGKILKQRNLIIIVILIIVFSILSFSIDIPIFKQNLRQNLDVSTIAYTIVVIAYGLNPLYVILALNTLNHFESFKHNPISIAFISLLIISSVAVIMAEYALILILFIIIPFIAFGWDHIKSKKKVIISIMICVIIFLYSFLLNTIHLGIGKQWFQPEAEATERSLNTFGYSANVYIKNEIGSYSVLTNDGSKVPSIITNPVFPGPEQLYVHNKFLPNTNDYKLLPIIYWPRDFYTNQGLSPTYDYYKLFSYNDINIINKYNISYVVQDLWFNNKYLITDYSSSPFLDSLSSNYYSTFINDNYAISYIR